MRDRDNQPLSQIYAEKGKRWAELEAAASLLEDSKSAWVAQRQTMLPDMAVNKAEQTVKASREYTEYIKTMVNARKEANLARIELEVVKFEFSEWQSAQANLRVEAKLG